MPQVNDFSWFNMNIILVVLVLISLTCFLSFPTKYVNFKSNFSNMYVFFYFI